MSSFAKRLEQSQLDALDNKVFYSVIVQVKGEQLSTDSSRNRYTLKRMKLQKKEWSKDLIVRFIRQVIGDGVLTLGELESISSSVFSKINRHSFSRSYADDCSRVGLTVYVEV